MANEIQLTQDQLAQFELIRLTTENSTLLEGLAQLNHQFAIEDGQQAPPMPFQEWIAARLDDEAMYIALVLEDGIPIGYVLIFDVMTHPFIPDWHDPTRCPAGDAQCTCRQPHGRAILGLHGVLVLFVTQGAEIIVY